MKSNTNGYEYGINGCQRLGIEIDFSKHTCYTIDRLLATANEKGRNFANVVAHHLVGAMLEVMYPDIEIEILSRASADQLVGHACDFMINDTMIHVALGPTEALLATCHTNIELGFRPMILTLEDRIGTARSLADYIRIEDRVTVRGVEEFFSRNIDAMASYSTAEIRRVLRQLFDTYNSRVAAVEPDPSLLVEIPENLIQT